MAQIEIKRQKDKYRVSLFHSDNPKKPGRSYYWNMIDKDAKKLAQVFIDLWAEGFPIEKAYKIMQERLKRKDWLGL